MLFYRKLTGFPGRPRTSLFLPLRCREARVVGFPGFIATLAKWISAPNWSTSTWLRYRDSHLVQGQPVSTSPGPPWRRRRWWRAGRTSPTRTSTPPSSSWGRPSPPQRPSPQNLSTWAAWSGLSCCCLWCAPPSASLQVLGAHYLEKHDSIVFNAHSPPPVL